MVNGNIFLGVSRGEIFIICEIIVGRRNDVTLSTRYILNVGHTKGTLEFRYNAFNIVNNRFRSNVILYFPHRGNNL